MVAWQRNGYLDPGVWEQFQSRINPAALPSDISTLQLAAPAGQSAVLSYMVNIFLKFNIDLLPPTNKVWGKAMFPEVRIYPLGEVVSV